MQNLIFIIAMAVFQPLTGNSAPTQPLYAVLPNDPIRINIPKQIKRSRGKGKGQSPWFAKFM